jgi:hypothetical protein
VSPRDDLHLDPELIGLLALGESPATPDELAAPQRHLALCGQCSSEVDELAAVTRQVRQVSGGAEPMVAPPAHVWGAVVAEVDAQATPSTDVVVLAARRRVSWVATAAAACVGLLVGGGAMYLATSPQRATTPPAAVVASASLAPLPGSTASGNVEVVSTAAGPRVQVDVTGLAPVDGYYEVWLLDRNGQKLVALGALDGSARGSFAMPQGIAMTDYPVVDVSLQAPNGDPSHSHHSLVRGTLPT